MDLRTQIRVSVRAHKMGLLQAQFVSIHARPCGRAMKGLITAPAPFNGFNPRPPLRAGDADRLRRAPRHQPVSIHARPCGRAMAMRRLNDLGGYVSIHARPCGRAMLVHAALVRRTDCFNPRPPLRAGDVLKTLTNAGGGSFHSTPALAGGRCRLARRHGFAPCGFNPRPPLRASDV